MKLLSIQRKKKDEMNSLPEGQYKWERNMVEIMGNKDQSVVEISKTLLELNKNSIIS